MVRLASLPEPMRGHLGNLPCPTFETSPFVDAPPASDRRVALVSTAGLHRRDDRPFGLGSDDYRVIPGEAEANDLVMSHVSTNFDRTGFQQDLNVLTGSGRWPITERSAAWPIITTLSWEPLTRKRWKQPPGSWRLC